MMFKNNFVAVVTCQDKILREHDGVVILPFGSDYSLKLKNLESKKALVNVSIDGQDVLSGSQLILHANSETILEGFLDGNDVKNKFRFIQKTKEIVEHRGDRIDDGIIRVEYKFEEPVSTINYNWTFPPTEINPAPQWRRNDFIYDTNQSTFGGFRGINSTTTADSALKGVPDCSFNAAPAQDEGITVRGEDANQHFNQGHIGTTGESHVITIRLRGTRNAERVSKPIHTTTKLTCSSCGLRSTSSAKFCTNCGTRL